MRYETVGSFLPPLELINAKSDVNAGRMSRNAYRLAEDSAVRDIVARQLEAGLDIVTSGELRRDAWDKDFYSGLGGVSVEHIDGGRVYQPFEVFTDVVKISGRISYNSEHPFFNDFEFLQECVGAKAECRQCIPSPGDLYLELLEHAAEVDTYPGGGAAVARDIAAAYRRTIERFHSLGCRHIQFDDTACARLTDPVHVKHMLLGGVDPGRLAEEVTALINESASGRPAGMELSVYISAGENVVPDWSSSLPEILPRLSVDKYFLPFFADAPEALGVLASVPRGRHVVLGLVAAHSPGHEDAELITDAVNAASAHVPVSCLALSPACGFRLTNFLSRGLVYADQWRKLKELAAIAAAI